MSMTTKIKVIVETGKDGFGCFMPERPEEVSGMHGAGKTARKAIEDFYVCYEEEKKWQKEQGKEPVEMEFEFIFDIGAFFNYYCINVTAFAQYAGMNASLLRQYACGLKTPTKQTIDKLSEIINKFKKDIDAGLLIDRPVLQYI